MPDTNKQIPNRNSIPEMEAQSEILTHILQALCPAEMNADGRWYIQKLIARIDKKVKNETERLKNQTADQDHNQHS